MRSSGPFVVFTSIYFSDPSNSNERMSYPHPSPSSRDTIVAIKRTEKIYAIELSGNGMEVRSATFSGEKYDIKLELKTIRDIVVGKLYNASRLISKATSRSKVLPNCEANFELSPEEMASVSGGFFNEDEDPYNPTPDPRLPFPCGIDDGNFCPLDDSGPCGLLGCGGNACFLDACGLDVHLGFPCGADACGADVGGPTGCGADACGGNACLVDLCGANACPADACVIDACVVNSCAPDACALDVVPFIPRI